MNETYSHDKTFEKNDFTLANDPLEKGEYEN